MNKELTITLIEVNNSEAPNIGTIHSSSGHGLYEKAVLAIESHFDEELDRLEIQDGLTFEDVRNCHPLDAIVYFKEGNSYKIEIQQTFLY